MAQISEITVNKLFENFRFDSEYFEPKYLHNQETLAKLQTVPLNDPKICIVSDGNHLSVSEYFSDEGIPYYRGQNINDFFLENAEPIYIPKEIYQKGWMKRSHFKTNDILLSIVGTVGSISLVTEEIEEATGSCKIAILRPQNINPYYLGAFLLSKYGQDQIKRNIRGAVQMGLILEDMKFVNVFVASEKEQDKISEIVDRSVQNNRKAKSLYSQAEQLLLQELGLKNFVPQWVAGYETDFDNILEVARMDAEYFQPRYEIVKDKIRAVDFDTLGNLVKPLKKGIEVGSEAYTDEGIPFLRVSNIEKLRIDNSSEQYIEVELYEELKDKFCPKKGEIILSKDGTPGIAYHLTEDVKTIISGGIVRLKTVEIEPEYLTLVLNSLIVQAQIEQDAGGALIKHWRPDQIKTTLIPILPKTVREKIVAMVQESFSALLESRQLLEQAKREVEEMIESKTN